MTKFVLTALLACISWLSNAQTLGDPNGIIYAMDIQPDDCLLAAVVGKSRVEIWDYSSQILLKAFPVEAKGNAIALGDGYLVLAREDGFVEIFSMSDFKQLALHKVSDFPLNHIEIIDGKKFAVADGQGTVFIADTIKSGMEFRKWLTLSQPIAAMDYFPEAEVLVTSAEGAALFFWSLETGQLVSKQETSYPGILAIKGDAPDHKMLVAFANGKMIEYQISGENFTIKEIFRQRPGPWPLALDCYGSISAAGTTDGRVSIYTRFGEYKIKINAMVNSIRIIPNQFPQIQVAVGTHGRGIRLLMAKQMKAE